MPNDPEVMKQVEAGRKLILKYRKVLRALAKSKPA
jgi:hypothetical protein